MTIHQIECFLEAARTLNFTEAANHLYISQQGLSRQIASLEKELELRLFDRTTRDVRLTRSGELLLWRWKDIPKEYMTPWIWPGRRGREPNAGLICLWWA